MKLPFILLVLALILSACMTDEQALARNQATAAANIVGTAEAPVQNDVADIGSLTRIGCVKRTCVYRVQESNFESVCYLAIFTPFSGNSSIDLQCP